MTLLRCVHCGHEQAFYMPANGHYYDDIGGASILLCGRCHSAAFRIVAEEDRETSTTRRLASVTYAYGSLGEYVEVDGEAENSAIALRQMALAPEAADQMERMLDDPSIPAHAGESLHRISTEELLRRERMTRNDGARTD